MKDPKKILMFIDSLIQNEDTLSLVALRDIFDDLIRSNYHIDKISFIDLNKYLDKAINMLRSGESSQDIINLPIRRVLESDYSEDNLYVRDYTSTDYTMAREIKQMVDENPDNPDIIRHANNMAFVAYRILSENYRSAVTRLMMDFIGNSLEIANGDKDYAEAKQESGEKLEEFIKHGEKFIRDEMIKAIKRGKPDDYHTARFPFLLYGRPVVFNGVDFSRSDFYRILADFFEFDNCNLSEVENLQGQPITIKNCSAVGLDIRGLELDINASDSDFTGMIYDKNTVLAGKSRDGEIKSTFKNCVLDPDAIDHFKKQGVVFIK